MKKRWQQLQAWLAGKQAVGLAALRDRLTGLRTQAGRVPWRMVGGTVAGMALVYLVYLALATPATPRRPGPSPVSTSKQYTIAQRLRAGLTPTDSASQNDYEAHWHLDDSLTATTSRLQKRDSSRHHLTLGELLHFRQQVASQDTQLYDGLTFVRRLDARAINSARGIASAYSYDRLKVLLTKSQAALLAITDSIQCDLATMQRGYLQQPGGQSACLLVDYRLLLARLQLADARHQAPESRQDPRQDTLAQQKLALATTLELLQGEASTRRDALSRQLVDSCLREVALLRQLDAWRAQQRWAAASLAPWAVASLAAPAVPAPQADTTVTSGPPAASSGYDADSTASDLIPIEAAVKPSFRERYVYPVLVALGYLLILLPFILLPLGWLQTRRGLPTASAQERESPVLQLLLQAYAGHIRSLLRTPRQVKRFAGKVRLQHHLLGVLAQQQLAPPAAAPAFTFGPAEQVLAFVLLLLIEESGQASTQQHPDEAAFAQGLREAYQQALAAGQLDAQLPGQFDFQGGNVWLLLAPADAAEATPHTFSLALAKPPGRDPNQHFLLRQLYWLNAGLLV